MTRLPYCVIKLFLLFCGAMPLLRKTGCIESEKLKLLTCIVQMSSTLKGI